MEEGTGSVRDCTLRMPDDRERRDATLIATALEGEMNLLLAACRVLLGLFVKPLPAADAAKF
jgi:hypothetical protein